MFIDLHINFNNLALKRLLKAIIKHLASSFSLQYGTVRKKCNDNKDKITHILYNCTSPVACSGYIPINRGFISSTSTHILFYSNITFQYSLPNFHHNLEMRINYIYNRKINLLQPTWLPNNPWQHSLLKLINHDVMQYSTLLWYHYRTRNIWLLITVN